METDTQIVQIFAELQSGLLSRKAVPLADGQVLFQADVVARVLLQCFTYADPGRGQRRTHVGKLGDVMSNLVHHLLKAAAGGQIGCKGLLEAGEPPTQRSLVDLPMAILLLVLDDQDRAAVAQQFGHVQPVVEVRVLLARVGHQQIERPFRKKELVRRMVDLLAAEVPDVYLEGASVVERELPADDVDAPRGVFFPKLIIGICDLLDQSGLACPSFSDDEQLGLVEVIGPRGCELAKVLPDGFKTLFCDLWWRDFDGKTIQVKKL